MSRREPLVVDRPDLRPTSVGRAEVEDLLYREAFLLDDWRMEEWLELWEEDAEYVVPTNDNPHADPENDLMYINHDYRLLKGLVDVGEIVGRAQAVRDDMEKLAHRIDHPSQSSS